MRSSVSKEYSSIDKTFIETHDPSIIRQFHCTFTLNSNRQDWNYISSKFETDDKSRKRSPSSLANTKTLRFTIRFLDTLNSPFRVFWISKTTDVITIRTEPCPYETSLHYWNVSENQHRTKKRILDHFLIRCCLLEL